MKEQLPVSQERKCAIKVAATHANSIPVVIERNNRCQYQIQPPRCHDFAVLRLGKSVPIGNQRAVGG